MDRAELKEIIHRVIERVADAHEDDAPAPACLFGDDSGPCDATTKYGISEEG